MVYGNHFLLGQVQDLSVLKNRVLRHVPWTVGLVVLAVGLLAAPGTAPAAIVITDSANTTPWQILSPTAGTTQDGPMSGTQSFTITAGTTNSVLIVNYTEVAQTNANGDAATTITWNGTPLTRAISQVSGASSNIYAEIFYLFNPTPAVNGSLSVTGSGRTGLQHQPRLLLPPLAQIRTQPLR